LMEYGREGNLEQSPIDRLMRHTDAIYLRGQVSNVLVALDLYASKKNVPRAKGYVTRFLSLHRSGEDKSLMRGVFAPGEKPASGGPLEEELPKVVGILEGIEHDRNLEKKSLGEAKAFLIALEQKLTKMAEEQEGPALETWRFAHKQ